MLTKGYSHLDGSQCYNNDDVDGGDINDDDDSDEFADVDEAGVDNHDSHYHNFGSNNH